MLRRFYDQFLPAGVAIPSLPLKRRGFKTEALRPHAKSRSPKVRSAAALASAAAANRVPLRAGQIIPRYLADPPGVLENGACSDIIKSGMAVASLDDSGGEALQLTQLGVSSIQSLLSSEAIYRHFGSNRQ